MATIPVAGKICVLSGMVAITFLCQKNNQKGENDDYHDRNPIGNCLVLISKFIQAPNHKSGVWHIIFEN